MGQRFPAVTPHNCLWRETSQNPRPCKYKKLPAKQQRDTPLQTPTTPDADPARLLSAQPLQSITSSVTRAVPQWQRHCFRQRHSKPQMRSGVQVSLLTMPHFVTTLMPCASASHLKKQEPDQVSASSSPAQAPDGGRCSRDLSSTGPSCAPTQTCSAPMGNPLGGA